MLTGGQKGTPKTTPKGVFWPGHALIVASYTLSRMVFCRCRQEVYGWTANKHLCFGQISNSHFMSLEEVRANGETQI